MRRFFWVALASILIWQSAFASSVAQNLFSGSFDTQIPILSPAQAFRVTVRRSGNIIDVKFLPSPGYYLYRDRLHFVLNQGESSRILNVALPPAVTKNDPAFGIMAIYPAPFDAFVHLPASFPAEATLSLTYQGCSERGICYPPQKKIFRVNALNTQPEVSSYGEGGFSGALTGKFWGRNFIDIGLVFAGFGLLLAFTPCMLPMLPILSGIILGQGENITRIRALILSLCYVLGMALAYTLAGIAAGVSGLFLTDALQNPWLLGGFSLLFIFLALSMFGFYSLELPHSLQNRLHSISHRVHGGGGMIAVFLTGALSAVIVGPCVAPPLAGALLYISRSHNIFVGGFALFCMAIGMGLPLVAIGVSAGALLPRAGAWMERVRVFFGLMLLATGLYVASPVLPAWILMTAAALLSLLTSWLVWRAAPGFRRSWQWTLLLRLAAILFLAIGLAESVGVLRGGRDVLAPLSIHESSLPAFIPVQDLNGLNDSLAAAHGRYVMLDFYADWCISCKEMDRFVFERSRVKQKLSDFVLLRADVTSNSVKDEKLLAHFGLYGPPAIICFDKQGHEIVPARLIGTLSADRFIAHIDQFLAHP
ncbi:MAG: protein-disulfide reductase DsbD [Pseudomonadota bacterium]|nr:protein-disulfide reductase DsbD [Pseudomonadota bacterium]